MWAYKFIKKETRTHVPSFQTFFFQNQELLQLWYEDETEPYEGRVSFWMRCLKYFGHLFIFFTILVSVIGAQDQEFVGYCNRRLSCFSQCNRAFFPSLACQDVADEIIELNGNTFNKFYKYPKPSYVKQNFQE